MPSSKRSGEFNPTIVAVERPAHHFCYLQAPNGDWLASHGGGALHVQGHVDDAAIWDVEGDGFVHAVAGLRLEASATQIEEPVRLRLDGREVGADGMLGDGVEFTVGHGPEKLPSAYLQTMREKGWVSLTCILSPSVVDGLQQVGLRGRLRRHGSRCVSRLSRSTRRSRRRRWSPSRCG